ncbi:MAG: hypothetical protein HKM93_08935 [Desulfobacteraceae bacterium]|nr:hypothetical protein [Desulfobacteraceae bacterium]
MRLADLETAYQSSLGASLVPRAPSLMELEESYRSTTGAAVEQAAAPSVPDMMWITHDPGKQKPMVPDTLAPAHQPENNTSLMERVGKPVAEGALDVAAAPSRMLLDLTRAGMTVADLLTRGRVQPFMGEAKPGGIRDRAGKAWDDTRRSYADMSRFLKMVDEPYSDTAMSFMLGGGAGMGMRAFKESSKPAAIMARHAGITEPLTITGVKSGLVAGAGDKFIIDPATQIIENKVMATDLSPRTKQFIMIAAPLMLGLISGATIEAKMDRLLKNPLAVGLFDDLATRNASPDEVMEKFKSAELDVTDEPHVTELKDLQSVADATKKHARQVAGMGLEDEAQGQLKTSPSPPEAIPETPAAKSAAVFAQALADEDRLRQSPRGRDLLVDALKKEETDALEASVRRGAAHLAEHPELNREIGRVVAGDIPGPAKAAQAVRGAKIEEIENRLRGRKLADIDTKQLGREVMAFDYAGRKDLADILREEIAFRRNRAKAERPKPEKGETLRWKLSSMGGVDFLNFKGELEDIPPMVRRSIARRGGMPIDLAEAELKKEGWLDPGEDLLELLKYNPDALRRRNLFTDISDRKAHLTDREQRLKAEMDHEPEMPEGFEDLPGHLQAKVARGEMEMKAAQSFPEDTKRAVGQNIPFAVAGGAAGVERDEQGNISFDPKKALLGTMAGAAGAYGVQRMGRRWSRKGTNESGFADKEISDLYDYSITDKSNKPKEVVYRQVTDDQAIKIKNETGLEVSGYSHAIGNYAIKHIMKRHGDPVKETPRGQIAITREDIRQIPDITENPDKIELLTTKLNKPGIGYTKRYNGTVFYLEEVRTGKKKLSAVTMRKMKATTPDASPRSELDGEPPAGTSETFRGQGKKKISTKTDDVKSKNTDVDPSNKLQIHPSTITGPIGAIAAGVDWEEYNKTGEIKFDAKRALIGAFAAGAGTAAAKRLGPWITTKWPEYSKQRIIEPMRRMANGLVVNEELRHGLGLNRSEAFKDVLRDHYRDVERAWNAAAEFGRDLQKIAPTALEQKRLMQVMRGGITASEPMRVKADQAREIYARLRKQLEEYDLLHYSRFDKITRKERAKLRDVIARDKDQNRITEEDFNKKYDIEPDGVDWKYRRGADGPDMPEHSVEKIPVAAYDGTPKSSAEWARQKLHDHYHYATAEEYAPIYYNKHEGLSPKQQDVLRDEIDRLKVKSRRGNPEGKPELEHMIAELEKMLGGGWKARRELRSTRNQLNKRYSHRRQEIPFEIQKLLGVMEEAAFPVAKMMGVQKSDVLKGRLFKEISENPEWAIATRLKDPRTGETVRVYGGDPPANYVKVDDDRFGALDGMHVRRDIWEDLREVEEWRGAFVRNYDKLMGAWKFGKVVLNPATHARNTMSNVMLAYMGDVNPADVKTYSRAAKALKTGPEDKFFKEAEEWGLFNDTFVSSEITKLRDELDVLRDGSRMKNWIRRAVSLPAEVYQGNEKFFKLAVFIKARNAGKSVDDAARKAEKYLFNYADIPPWVKHMKRWVSPFFTFTYKAMPLFAEMAIRKPWKVAAIAGAMYGLEQYAIGKTGMDKEEAENQRRLLPEWQQRKTLGIGPYNHVMMPWRDKWGNNLYLDMSYILPYGNVGEKWGQSALPLSDLLPSNPLFGVAAAMMTNKDSFTGRPIYSEIMDGAGRIAAKYLDYAWKEAVPSLAPGGHGFNKLKTGIRNTFMGKDVRDWADRPIEFSTAVLSSILGIKLSPANERKLSEFELITRRRIANEVDKEIYRLQGKARRNEISKKEMKKQVDEMAKLKRQLLENRPEP